jgi:hypothetical protein
MPHSWPFAGSDLKSKADRRGRGGNARRVFLLPLVFPPLRASVALRGRLDASGRVGDRRVTRCGLPRASSAALTACSHNSRILRHAPFSDSSATRLPVSGSRSRMTIWACGLCASSPLWWIAASHDARPRVTRSAKTMTSPRRCCAFSSRGKAAVILSITRAFLRSCRSSRSSHRRAALRSSGIRPASRSARASGRVM